MRTLLLAVAITAALPTPAAACHRYLALGITHGRRVAA